MAKWTIYGKNGNELHESITEFNGDGKIVYQDTLEYSGKWMGERFLTVSIKSAYPIDFQIGDYIEYRGEKFTINYDPTVIKKARRGTYGEGFTYDSIKFNSPSNELTQMRFHDWVLSDNNLHYTSLPTFTFYAKDVDDLVDRLQACSDRWCKDNGYAKEDYWMFYTLRNNTVSGTEDTGQHQTTYQRTVQRAKDVLECCGISETGDEGKAYLSSVQTSWEKMYGTGGSYTDSRDDERYDRNISVSSQSVWDGMAMIKQQFGLNFIVRGRNVFIGTAGIPTSHLFKYGKGNGLYEVDKTADQDQLVVTRLHAYGGSDNLPTRYYADLNTEAYAKITNLIRTYNLDYKTLVCEFNVDISFSTRYFTEKIQNDTADVQYNVGLKFDSYVASQSQTNVRKDDNGTFVQAFFIDNDATEGQASQLLVDIKGNIRQGKTVVFTYGVKKDAWPVDHLIASTENLPDNMAVNFLMLPGFPNNALSEICRAVYDSKSDTTNYYITNPSTKKEVLFHTESGNHVVKFSSDKYDPYIVSPNAESLGIKDGDISCTEENDDNGLEKVYPSIEEITDADAGIGSAGNRLDEIYKADTIEDNGVYPKSKTSDEDIPGFHVWLPALGFDLKQAAKDAGGEVEISMKDGFNGGRSFSVGNITEEKNGTWNLLCKRSPDSSLDLYFPYSYAASVADVDKSMTDAYQICKGDHYVLTGIAVSDVNYVWAASVKLLRKAIHWLCKNDYTRYVYSPKIDEIYMAREAEDAKQSGRTSLHDSLMEGDILLFSDEDLQIDGNVYIDQLNIKENGNNGIPTYEVTLRNEVTVGSLQRLQNKVDSIANDVRTGSVGGGLTSPSQVASLIEAYGEQWFVSKVKDDVANGLITFLKGFVSKAKATFEDAAEIVKGLVVGGDATFKRNADIAGDTTVGGTLTADEVISKTRNDGIEDILGGKGFKLWMSDGISKLVIDKLSVRMKAYFTELEIRKLSYSAGNLNLSGAGAKFDYVARNSSVTKDGKVVPATYARCYFLANDGDSQTVQLFHVGDMVMCRTFNIAKAGSYKDTSNRYYWRTCIAVSNAIAELNGKKYHYIDLALTEKCTIDGKQYPGYDTVTLKNGETNDTPSAGDEVAAVGNLIDEDRQNVVQLVAIGDYAPSVNMYDKIGYGGVYCLLSDHWPVRISPKGVYVNADYFKLIVSQDGKDTETAIDSYVSGLVDSGIKTVTDRMTKVEADITGIQTTVSQHTTDIGNLTKEQTTIKQTATDISLRVSSQRTGRNLWVNGDFEMDADLAPKYSYNLGDQDGNAGINSIDLPAGFNKRLVFKCSQAFQGIYYNGTQPNLDLTNGTTYCLSFFAKVNIPVTGKIYFGMSGVNTTTEDITSTWKRYRIYITPDKDYAAKDVSIVFYPYTALADSNGNVGYICITGIQFETGSESSGAPTVWAKSTFDIKQTTGIDIESGQINAIAGLFNFVGANGKPYIEVTNKDGYPHLIFLDPTNTDNDGNPVPAYDLGYTGLTMLIGMHYRSFEWMYYYGTFDAASTVKAEFLYSSPPLRSLGYKYDAQYFVNGKGATVYIPSGSNQYNGVIYNTTSYDSTGTIPAKLDDVIPDGWHLLYVGTDYGKVEEFTTNEGGKTVHYYAGYATVTYELFYTSLGRETELSEKRYLHVQYIESTAGGNSYLYLNSPFSAFIDNSKTVSAYYDAGDVTFPDKP